MFGLVVAAFFMPFGTMLIIEGTREAYEGRQPSYGVLVELFKDPFKRSRLMRVGVIYAAFLLVANYLYIFMAVDEVSQWQVWLTADSIGILFMPISRGQQPLSPLSSTH